MFCVACARLLSTPRWFLKGLYTDAESAMMSWFGIPVTQPEMSMMSMDEDAALFSQHEEKAREAQRCNT